MDNLLGSLVACEIATLRYHAKINNLEIGDIYNTKCQSSINLLGF